MSNRSRELDSFFADQPIRMYIGGRWTGSSSGDTFETLDPGKGERLALVAAGDANDVDVAVRAAREAFASGRWSGLRANERAVILHRLADLIDKHSDTLSEIESLDVGKPRTQARAFDIPHSAKTFRYYADLSIQTRRSEPIAVTGNEARSVSQPCGVCGFIFPWNFPFLLLSWGVAPALAAGNPVVVKPAEDTPLSALYFARLAEEAGFPAGVFNVVTGFGETAGAALAKHPGLDRMSFTGSPEVGRLIAEACGRNLIPVKLELGGKGAAVLFDDIAVEQAADALVGAVTLNAGQVCCTATRWLVHESIKDRFIAKAVSLMGDVRIGYGGDSNSQLGPVVSDKQRKRVLSYLERGKTTGAKVFLWGGPTQISGYDGGFYVKPALLGGSPDNICAREEIFGPIAYVIGFRNEAEGVEVVNRSRYGLANSVWSTDLDRANRVAEQLKAGNSWINAHNVFAHGVPYAGVNMSGNGGGVLGPGTLDDYFHKQSVVRPLTV
jgi:acyl-CoA reductase-like NAD-dependent aldehyde dehydrogenase